MSITTHKKIWGYKGAGIMTCNPIFVNDKVVRISNNAPVTRCKIVENRNVSYYIQINYPDENHPYALWIDYEFKVSPTPDEFIPFDSITSQLRFLK